jgi:hypothetical protein
MEKEFVPYEQALELKELGFDEPCFGLWNLNNGKYEVDIIGVCQYSKEFKYREVLAPLYQQAFRWFRKKHGISVSISINWEEGIGKDSSYGKYACSLQHKSYDESIGEFIGVFKRYEEAELECLKELIEMVKENEL